MHNRLSKRALVKAVANAEIFVLLFAFSAVAFGQAGHSFAGEGKEADRLPAQLQGAALPMFDNEPAAGTTIVHPGDGAVMVWVPTGPFIMGMNADEAEKLASALGYESYHDFAAEEYFPRRIEWTRGYFIDKYEVAVWQWKNFEEASGFESEFKAKKYARPKAPGAYDLYPVVRVLWAESQVYVNYFGKALPTEKQWEKAARGTDGRWFPWGNDIPTPEHGAMSGDIEGDDGSSVALVGSSSLNVSPYGVMDMSGNVYEWTSAWMEPYPNNPERERIIDYMGQTNGVLRGGSFYHARHALVSAKRFGFRPHETYFHVGFRSVWEPPADYFKSDAYEQAREAVAAAERRLSAMRENAEKAPRAF